VRKPPPASGSRKPDLPSEAGTDAEPSPFVLSLRDVEVPPASAPDAVPLDDGLVRSDPDARAAPWLGDPEAERAELKAGRRAQVRRERQHNTAQGELTPEVPAILVLCPVDAASRPLCALLDEFGFAVSTAKDPPAFAAPWPFVAVFIDLTLGAPSGADPIDLCNRVRESSRLPGERKPVLMLVAAQLGSTDRVRAGLAGCNEVIVGEVSRGSVARALEARGIALPSDARRG
jgi:CheY-like chemotaxis protein